MGNLPKQGGLVHGACLAPVILLVFCACVDCRAGDFAAIDDVPFYAQEAYQCGPASLAGVMGFWGLDISPDEIARDVYSKSARGTLDIDMVIYPQSKGLLAEQYSGGMDDLRQRIDDGYPLIVLVDYGLWVLQANHFMVVTGYDGKGVIVNSGKRRAEFIPKKQFVKVWKRAKFWTLLIKKAGK